LSAAAESSRPHPVVQEKFLQTTEMPRYRNTYEENLEILLDEIKLAVQWDRPSLLLTVHRSNLGRDKISRTLEERIVGLGLQVNRLVVSREHPNPARMITEEQKNSQLIYFISNLEWGGGEEGNDAFKSLNLYREQFVEQHIKAVFWLTMNEASNLARFAPDFWAFRHRVVEFASPRTRSGILLPAGVLHWPISLEFARADDLPEMIDSREIMLTGLPEEPESLSTRLELILQIGYLHWKAGQSEVARQYFNRGIQLCQADELKSYRMQLLSGSANLNYEAGEYGEAARINKQIFEENPGDNLACMNLAFCLAALGKKQEAENQAHKAIRIRVDQPVLWNSLGYLQLAIGKLDEGVESFQHAIELSPKSASNHASLAVCYAQIGLEEEASQELNAADKLDPGQKEYLEICNQLIAGNETGARKLIEAAVGSGRYSIVQFKQDPNISILLDLSRFSEMMEPKERKQTGQDELNPTAAKEERKI